MNSAKQAGAKMLSQNTKETGPWPPLWPLLDLPQLLRDLLSPGPTGGSPSFPGRPSDLKPKCKYSYILGKSWK